MALARALRRPMPRVLVAVVVLAGVVVGCSSSSTHGPKPSVSVAATTPTSLRVTWTAPGDANRWWVIVNAAGDDRSVGQRTACGTCREQVVEHLAPSSKYLVRVVAVAPDSSFGAFSDPFEASTPAMPGCRVEPGTVCAHIDASVPAGDATGAGLGFLHSVTVETAADRITPLRPRTWRVSAGDVEKFQLAKRFAGSVTVLLSDPWTTSTGSRAPWLDWDAYRMWLGLVADAYVASGQVPDYWEVQNEPQPDAYVGGAPVTSELVFQQYAIAAEVIHQRVPTAQVIGPSSSYVTFGSGLVDLDAFLASAVRAGAPPAGIAWHEIGASCMGSCDGSPRAVLQHADDVRAAIAANPGVGSPKLIVNEWGAPWNLRQPGAIVGFLSSMAYARVDIANPTCWPVTGADGKPVETCFRRPGTLDGLLLTDGATPTDAWYVHRAYADMTGDGRALLTSSIGDPEASIVATVDRAGVIKVLLGRHTGCQDGIDEDCAGKSYAGDERVQAILAVPGAAGPYRVTAERMRSVAGPSAGGVALPPSTVQAAGGRVDAGSWVVADGEAISLTLTPV